VLGTAACTSARQRCHPTRRASRVDLPLQGRWGDIVAVVVTSEMPRLLRQRIFSRVKFILRRLALGGAAN
jgi:hypothetical protein